MTRQVLMMAYKVVLVDDEPFIRKGMLNIINWEKLGCMVVGEAGNGMEGIELIRKEMPDIIITDIRMPEIDGLEMIRTIKNILPNSQIVILTGYRDFEYLQEALKLGASSYLLKPSKIEKLTAAIRKTCVELDLKKEWDANFSHYKDLFSKALPVLKEKLLNDILHKVRINTREIEKDLDVFQLKIDSFRMIMVEIDSHSETGDHYNRQLYKFGIKNSFESLYKDDYSLEYVNLDTDRLLFIMGSKVQSIEDTEEILSRAEDFQNLIRECFDFSVTLSVSNQGEGWQSLPTKATECITALDYKYYMGDGAIILYEDVNNIIGVKDYETADRLKSEVLRFVRLGDAEKHER